VSNVLILIIFKYFRFKKLIKIKVNFLKFPNSWDLLYGECRQRSNYPITNCAEYHSFKDQCVQCNYSKYILNSDGLECLVKSEGCISKVTSQCVQCTKEFVLDSGECKQPISECLEYLDQDSPQCNKCADNFSLNQSKVRF
jgi:hypothetical protein